MTLRSSKNSGAFETGACQRYVNFPGSLPEKLKISKLWVHVFLLSGNFRICCVPFATGKVWKLKLACLLVK